MHARPSKNLTTTLYTQEHALILKREQDQEFLDINENEDFLEVDVDDRYLIMNEKLSEGGESPNTGTPSEEEVACEDVTFSSNAHIICIDCGVSFETKENFDKHKTKCIKFVAEESIENSNIKNRTCATCLKVFKSVQHMKKHLHLMHGSTNEANQTQRRTCPKCFKVYKSARSMKQHLNKIHNRKIEDIKSRTCPICSKVFSDVGHCLKKHMRRIHGNQASAEERTCSICSKIFPNVYTLKEHVHRQHQKEHQNIKNRTCNICSKVYATAHSMREHKRTYHQTQKKPIKNLTCHKCSAVFSRVQLLNQHIRRKHSENEEPIKDHTCPKCSKMHSSNLKMKEHLQICCKNEDIENRICPICSKVVQSSYKLNDHILRLHQNTKLFPINSCNQNFTTTVERNNKHHGNDIKWQTCSVCDIIIPDNNSLLRHMRSYHKIKFKILSTFDCNNCAKCSECLEKLDSHVQKKFTYEKEEIATLEIHENTVQNCLEECQEDQTGTFSSDIKEEEPLDICDDNLVDLLKYP